MRLGACSLWSVSTSMSPGRLHRAASQPSWRGHRGFVRAPSTFQPWRPWTPKLPPLSHSVQQVPELRIGPWLREHLPLLLPLRICRLVRPSAEDHGKARVVGIMDGIHKAKGP